MHARELVRNYNDIAGAMRRIIRPQARQPEAWIGGALIGAAAGSVAMYLLDPRDGARRRAIVHDKTLSLARNAGATLEAATRDLSHRAHGLRAEMSARFHEVPADDVAVERRVRSELGRVVSHPGAITVSCNDGVVELTGPILKSELAATLRRLGAVRGVQGLENRLDVHERPDHVPALQGGVPRRPRFELLQKHWTPGPRLLVFAAGAACIGFALGRRDAIAPALGLCGAALITRSTLNRPVTHLTSRSGAPQDGQRRQQPRIDGTTVEGGDARALTAAAAGPAEEVERRY